MIRLLRVAKAAGVALVILYAFTVLTWPGQVIDEWFLGVTQRLGVGPLGHALPLLGRRGIPAVVTPAVVVLALAALPRRAPQVLTALVFVGLTTGTSLVLKHSLPRPLHGGGIGYVVNTFPSTHASATLALIVAAWWLVPRRPAWLAAGFILVAGTVAIGNVVGHAHRPSDVLGSILLVGVVGYSTRAALAARARGYAGGAIGGHSATGRWGRKDGQT